jgi:hypothetical protein
MITDMSDRTAFWTLVSLAVASAFLVVSLPHWEFPPFYFSRYSYLPFYGTLVIYPRTPLWSNVIFYTALAMAATVLVVSAFPPKDVRARRRELLLALLTPIALAPMVRNVEHLGFYLFAGVGAAFLLFSFLLSIASLRRFTRSFSGRRLVLASGAAAMGFALVVLVEANNIPTGSY